MSRFKPGDIVINNNNGKIQRIISGPAILHNNTVYAAIDISIKTEWPVCVAEEDINYPPIDTAEILYG